MNNLYKHVVPLNTVMGNNIGKPIGVPNISYGVHVQRINPPPPLELPGEGIPRAVNYYADRGGCGWWRMIAPELLLNMNSMGAISGSTIMIGEERFYANVSSLRFQRQVTPSQFKFMEFIKNKFGDKLKIIYEIDDVILREDVPDYNRCKAAFDTEEIREHACKIMQLADEISVTCQYMKDYYIDKTGNKNITVIPNYPAKMWMDNHYNPENIIKNFKKFKDKPRIGYIGSSTHIDVTGKTNLRDDFYHVLDKIISTRKEIQWVFIGSYPLQCKPFIDRGEMEYVQWVPLLELWKAYTETNVQAVIAPLQNNIFNSAKSNIKFLEAATCGIPAICQDMITYEDSFLKFNTGSELIDNIKYLTKDVDTYNKISIKSRKYAENMWLDDHINEFKELYFTNIGSPERKELLKLNPVNQ